MCTRWFHSLSEASAHDHEILQKAINHLLLNCYNNRKVPSHTYGLPADLDPVITAV